MQALLVVLVLTNLATVAALVTLWRFYGGARPEDRDVLAALSAQRSGSTASRPVLTIEILNPVELAGTKGRVAGIAGSLVPGLTRRIVYDQTLKQLRKQLVDQGVVADVRLVKVTPADTEAAGAAPAVAVPTGRTGTTRSRPAAPPVPGATPAVQPLTDEQELLAVAAAESRTDADAVAVDAAPAYVDPYPGAFDPFVADPFEEPRPVPRQDPV